MVGDDEITTSEMFGIGTNHERKTVIIYIYDNGQVLRHAELSIENAHSLAEYFLYNIMMAINSLNPTNIQ